MKKTTKSYVLGLLVILFLLPNVVFAQSLTVEGTVNDETGEPLIGATVKVRPGGTGAITDLNGHFLLPSVERGATLEISFMGYKTQTRKVDGKPITIRCRINCYLNKFLVVICKIKISDNIFTL